MPSLLILTAHPDDETFLAGGTIAKAVAAGVRVELVCATRGDRGSTGDITSPGDLPRVREAELRAAAAILGIHHVELLPYHDRNLTHAPIAEIRPALVAAIRRVKPEIVLTFDPQGANEHPDHIAISRFASDAVSAAADERWFPEAGPAHQAARLLWTPPIAAFDLTKPADLKTHPGVDFLIDVSAFWKKKEEALLAHLTQRPSIHRVFFDRDNVEKTLSTEAFRLGWGRRPGSIPSDDIFAV